MRADLLDILVCPMDKAKLSLTVSHQEGDEIIEGSLRCEQDGEIYPIADGIPNLLPPDLRRAMEAEAGAASA